MFELDFDKYFSVQIFFIILRETIESAIIVSVLLSFINQNSYDGVTGHLLIDKTIYKKMKMQVWFGAFTGFGICLLIGGIFVTLFYIIGTDLWSYTERIWEGIFSILSSLIIAIMGFSLLRINAMKNKWTANLLESFKSHNNNNPSTNTESDQLIESLEKQSLKEKYFLAFLPFITTLREGLEAVVFIGGIGVNQPISSFPLAIIMGSLIGFSIGYIIYKGGNKMSIQYFLIISTCFLYLVAAGLISRGIWFLELEQFVQRCGGQDTSESGSGPGSYDINNTIWHVNCCNGLKDGGWMIFNALLGWNNTATYGSIISYVIFWISIILILKCKSLIENDGYIKYLPIKYQLKYVKKRVKIAKLLIDEIEENSI
ncbi:Fth1 protein [Pichia kluyveri]|uniref:Fth1 protein n=1 Tax=Pichia kluyveri TaxID=36015 RepID=A0AAV5R9J2_PICKL|nr:Fth1 protein [Pichia kluyveri]